MLDHRCFWDATRSVGLDHLAEVEHRLAVRMTETFGLDTSSVALDMINLATDSTNTRADIAQRGKAKQKRADLRLVGLGLVVTRDGGVPLLSHAYAGNHSDVIQFTTMVDALQRRHQAIRAARGEPDADMTAVFDAGQNSVANLKHFDAAGLHYVGSVPAPATAPTCSRCRPAPAPRSTPSISAASAPTTPAASSTASSAAPSSPTPPSCTRASPAASPTPPWPRPAAASTSWPRPLARAAGPAVRDLLEQLAGIQVTILI